MTESGAALHPLLKSLFSDDLRTEWACFVKHLSMQGGMAWISPEPPTSTLDPRLARWHACLPYPTMHDQATEASSLSPGYARRGDVGSWVREAAVTALAQLLPLWRQHARAQADQLSGSCVPVTVIGALLRQATERLDRLQKVGLQLSIADAQWWAWHQGPYARPVQPPGEACKEALKQPDIRDEHS